MVLASPECFYSGSSAIDTCGSDSDFSFLGVMVVGVLLLGVVSGIAVLIHRIYFGIRYRNPAARKRARNFLDPTGELAGIEQRLKTAAMERDMLVTAWRDRDPTLDYSAVDRLSTSERSRRLSSIDAGIRQLRRQAIKVKSARR